jgi:MerR family transcriptional regulator, light-induced transcriptional regulator
MSEEELRMRDVVERTGVGEATLRAWEERYGVPAPERLPSGHRRYRHSDVELVRRIARLRESGVGVREAIERASAGGDSELKSIFAGVRRLRPDLPVQLLPKRALIALSHAIEDESARAAQDLLLFGAFQRERFYRASERRWRELARATAASVVFADFAEPRAGGRPREVPIAVTDPLAREWAVVAYGSDRAVCMVGWEPPGQPGQREFETLWTTDPDAVRAAARICCALAGDDALAQRLDDMPLPRDDRAAVEALTSRMIAYLAAASR